MRYLSAAVVLGLMLVTVGSVAGRAERSTMRVRIINKSGLPTDRLAEAIAAKGLIAGDSALLREAARLQPNDPRYWYLMTATIWEPGCSTGTPRVRRLLERALAVDPDYLPALYAYTVTKPKHEQRMQGLERLARLDVDNAKPYYLMAITLFEHMIEDREIIRESPTEARPMSVAEWNALLALIRKGNDRGAFSASAVRLPSVRDSRVKEGRRVVPSEIVAGTLDIMVEYGTAASETTAGAPLGFHFQPYARQLCRQAVWEAHKAFRADHVSGALEMLRNMRAFARLVATSQPRRIVSVLVASSIWRIAAHQEIGILKATGQSDQLRSLEAQSVRWRAAAKSASKLISDNVKSKSEIRPYSEEETEASSLLAELGLIPKAT